MTKIIQESIKLIFVLSISLIFQLGVSKAQWVQMDGPYGNIHVSNLFQHDSSLFSFTGCGYFSKSQLADPWNLHLLNTYYEYTIKGDSLFAIASGAIYYIDLSNPDNPATILSMNGNQPNSIDHSDSCLYTGHITYGFGKYNFNGTYTYHNIGLPLDSNYIWIPGGGGWYYHYWKVTDVEVSSNFVYCGTTKGVYRNTGNLTSWTAINNGLPLSEVDLIKNFGNSLFTVIDNYLYMSVDEGNNWNLIYTAPSPITTVMKSSNIIYTGTTNHGISYSFNNGVNWNTLNIGLPDMHITSIATYDSTLVCGTDTSGVFYFQNNQWNASNTMLICETVRGMTHVDSLIVVNDFYNVYKFENNSIWTNITPNVNYSHLGGMISMGDTLFLSCEYNLSTWPWDFPFIVLSTNTGNTWDTLLTQVPFAHDDPYALYGANGRLYVRENGDLYFTENIGATWTDITINPNSDWTDLIVFNNVLYSTAGINLLKLDNSLNWVASDNGLPLAEKGKMATIDSVLFNYVNYTGIYASFDYGNNWTFAGNGLTPDDYLIDFVEYNSNLIITTPSGVFGTNNYGQNWYPFNEGLKNLHTGGILLVTDTLYVSTNGNGIWKRAVNEINSLSITEAESFENHKIFPNPASDFIMIPQGTSSVEIYDALGKLWMLAEPGNATKLDLSSLDNGLYFISIFSGKSQFTAKLVIYR